MASITLPKELKGFRFPQAIPFELNDFFIETIWPQIFRLVVLDGRDSSRGSVEQADIESSVSGLVAHDRVVGMNSASAGMLADKLVRSSLVRIVKTLKTKTVQIDALIPYSIVSFKAGFPTNAAGFRQVDHFLYELLLAQFDGNPTRLRPFFVEVFGSGVKVSGYPTPVATRADGEFAKIDVITELSISYVDHFDMVVPRRVSSPYVFSNPMPSVQFALGQDLKRFIDAYGHSLATPTLIEQLTTMVGFELSIWTVKAFNAFPSLLSNPGACPPAMSASFAKSPPEIYADMTAEPKSLSRTMAAACVGRDQLAIEPFVRAILRLRYTSSIVERMKRNPNIAKKLSFDGGSETTVFMRFLAALPTNPELEARFEAAVETDLDLIIATNRGNRDSDDGSEPSEVESLLAQLQQTGHSLLDQIEEVLFVTQGTKIRNSNLQGWIRSVGGVGKSWGLISGQSDRRSWCYAPGNDLLMVLVQLCAIDRPDWEANPKPQRFGLKHFLEWLERRFGILVDRPPADLGFDTPEHMAAARENLQAMLRRLRQMGIFEDRSDDFSVQKLTPPFMDQA